jgi:hypothetical protein
VNSSLSPVTKSRLAAFLGLSAICAFQWVREVFFKSQCLAPNLWMRFACEDLTYRFKEGTQVEVVLSVDTSKAQGTEPDDRIVCDVFTEREPVAAVKSMFECLSRREVPNGVNRRSLGPGVLDENGKISNRIVSALSRSVTRILALDPAILRRNRRPLGFRY